MRRRSSSMPLWELILLIQPWVLLRLMFLGWYSVPLFRVRTCWYCHGSCWNTPEPSACEESGPHLEIRGPAAALGTIQLLNNLRWELPVTARFPAGMLLTDHRITCIIYKCYSLISTLCRNNNKLKYIYGASSAYVWSSLMNWSQCLCVTVHYQHNYDMYVQIENTFELLL